MERDAGEVSSEIFATRDGARWYVVRVEPARDYRARDALRITGGFERATIFLAEAVEWRTYRGTQRRDGARYSHTGPLFPGYVFLRFDPLDGERGAAMWQRLLRVPHVTGLMCRVGGAPSPVGDPVALAADVRRRFGLGERGDPPPASPRFRRGERIRLSAGPLEGLEGTVCGHVRDRIKILLDVLGGSRVSEVPDTFVSAAVSA